MLHLLIVATVYADPQPDADSPADPYTQCVLTVRDGDKLKHARFKLIPSAEGHRVYEAQAGEERVRIVNNSGKAFALGKDHLGYVQDLADYPRRKAEGEIAQRKERAAYDRQRAKWKAEADADLKQLVDQGCDPVNHPMARSVRRRLAELTSIPFQAQYPHGVPPPEPDKSALDPDTLLIMTAGETKTHGVSSTWAALDGTSSVSRAVAAGKIKSESDLFAESLSQDGSLFGQGDLKHSPYTVHCAPLF